MKRITERLAQIRGTIADNRITIVGITKGQDVEKIREAIDAGLTDFGNNYVQEGQALRDALGPVGRWHFVGHIQSRKVKLLTEYDCVQSLDRIEIVESLDKRLKDAGRNIDGLVEVNLGDEASKSGISPNDLDEFVRGAAAFSNVRIRGLLVLPPPLFPIENRRPFFKQAKSLFDRHVALGWDCLSMGTSDDFEIAIQEGSTMIRLGTVLFGPRA